MIKYGVDLPAAHWEEIEEIHGKELTRAGFAALTEQWLRDTAKLLREPGVLPVERSSERMVKVFCRIVVFEARRQDLLTVSYVINALQRGSRTTVGQWVDDIKTEVLEQAQVHTRLSAIPEEFRTQAEDFILELWASARQSDEAGPATAQLNRLQGMVEKLQRELKQKDTALESLEHQNQRMAREVAQAQSKSAESEKDRAVALAQLEGLELALKGEQERYDQAIKEVELARNLADTHRKQLMMEIDRVRNIDSGWESKIAALKLAHKDDIEEAIRELRREQSLSLLFKRRANELEAENGKLKQVIEEATRAGFVRAGDESAKG